MCIRDSDSIAYILLIPSLTLCFSLFPSLPFVMMYIGGPYASPLLSRAPRFWNLLPLPPQVRGRWTHPGQGKLFLDQHHLAEKEVYVITSAQNIYHMYPSRLDLLKRTIITYTRKWVLYIKCYNDFKRKNKLKLEKLFFETSLEQQREDLKVVFENEMRRKDTREDYISPEINKK